MGNALPWSSVIASRAVAAAERITRVVERSPAGDGLPGQPDIGAGQLVSPLSVAALALGAVTAQRLAAQELTAAGEPAARFELDARHVGVPPATPASTGAPGTASCRWSGWRTGSLPPPARQTP